MSTLPANLPERLRKRGLKVVEIDGWRFRGRPASTGGFNPVGVLNHHTGARDVLGDFADDLSYANWMAKVGRADLPAPLVQLSLSLEGTVYVLAAGRSNHAGTAKSSGSVAAGDGNSLYCGIEWMLSGTQPIPDKMYHAGVVLNATLLDIFDSSVQAISCHYQTSVTGKWDIGDPSGLPFMGHKVFNVPKFRGAVLDYRRPKPEPDNFVDLTLGLAPMQFSDTPREMTADAKKIFGLGKHIHFGTEAGRGNDLFEILPTVARGEGYRWFNRVGDWLAVHRDIVKGGWDADFIPVLKHTEGVGHHGTRGVTWASFDAGLGLNREIHIAAAHYLTKGRKPGDPNFNLNRELAEAIGDWARAHGAGTNIVLYGGDQNIVDRFDDTFFGQPLTSLQDELKKWEGTGHGAIDVLATYDRDGAVSAKSVNTRTDKEFHLHTDHFYTEGVVRVRKAKAA
jgi:hypothetical protein